MQSRPIDQPNILQQIWKWDESALKNLTGDPDKINPLFMDSILENLVSRLGKLDQEHSRMQYALVQNTLFAPYLDMICGFWLPESGYRTYVEKNLGMTELECSPDNLE